MEVICGAATLPIEDVVEKYTQIVVPRRGNEDEECSRCGGIGSGNPH